MTREEAINYLRECSEAMGDTEHHTLSYAKEALNMAIKALSQQTEDAISRQAAVDATWLEPSYTDPLNVLTEVRDRITNLPSVIPTRPRGHWIDTADEINAKYGKHDYKCSKCGKYAERFIAGTEDWWSCVKPNYCPSCGAYMVESEGAE